MQFAAGDVGARMYGTGEKDVFVRAYRLLNRKGIALAERHQIELLSNVLNLDKATTVMKVELAVVKWKSNLPRLVSVDPSGLCEKKPAKSSRIGPSCPR